MPTNLANVFDSGENTLSDIEPSVRNLTYNYSEDESTAANNIVDKSTSLHPWSRAKEFISELARTKKISVKDSCIEDIVQHWSGVVIDCNSEEFTARLKDIKDPTKPDELMTLSLEDLNESERPLVESGAMFNWYIGYRSGRLTSRHDFSTLRFRRLPSWSRCEIDSAEKCAKELADFFGVDSN